MGAQWQNHLKDIEAVRGDREILNAARLLQPAETLQPNATTVHSKWGWLMNCVCVRWRKAYFASGPIHAGVLVLAPGATPALRCPTRPCSNAPRRVFGRRVDIIE